MGIKFANSAFATLASGINSSATSITLTTGQGARFPSLSAGDFFYATLIDTSNNLEIIKCTARSTDVLTVVRGQESTTARAYSTGDRIELRVTAAGFSEMAQLGVENTFTAKQIFTATNKIQQTLEKMTVSATAATGTINYDALTQAALYYTSNASGNFTLNFRGDGSTSLNTVMATGESLTLVFLNTNGATAYYNSAIQIDGSSVTPKWQGSTAPTSGNTSSIDAYVYNIVKTASATFTVLASQTQFK
jgi:hypothetical protein